MDGIFNPPTETQTSASLTNLEVIRSWKDPRYRRSLSLRQLQAMPEHPAGPAQLADQELKIAGGLMLEEESIIPLTTAIDCTEWTFHHWKSCGC